MDPARELAQRLGRLAEIVQRRVEQLGDLAVGPVDLRPRHAQVQRQLDEPLLRPVVQIALESLPRGVGGLHDPRARRPQLRLAPPSGR